MRYIALILINVLVTHYLIAQNQPCKVLLEKISGNYRGECTDGFANGKGKSVGEDTYIGIFKNGLPHGDGTYIYKNGDIFKGHWIEGQKDGKGKFQYSLNGKKNILSGYWVKDEYVGRKNPNLHYRIIAASGIYSYKFDKKETDNRQDKTTIIIRSGFLEFVPGDLEIEPSSGQVNKIGKRFILSQYIYPLNCEIRYTIVIGNIRKKCRFIFEIIEEGNYTLTLAND